MRGIRLLIEIAAGTAGCALFVAACTGTGVAPRGTTTGNVLEANVSLGFTGHRVLASAELPVEEVSATRLTFCLREIRFRGAEGTADQTLAFPWGEVVASREPTALGDFSVAPGEYRAVTLSLGPECGSTALVENPRGKFTSDSTVELTWPVSVTVHRRPTRLWLPVFPLLAEGARVSDGEQLPAALASAMDRLELWLEEEDVLQAGFAARPR